MTPSDVPTPRPRRERVSLEEVAQEAGVSVATASRALSGGAVRAVLRERVEVAAERLGYRPDLAAQAVARGATKTVALIVDYLRSPFGVEITRGVVDAASRHGLVVNVTGAETHPGDLLEMIASARALRPRSIVLATGRVQDPGIRDELIRALEAYQATGGSVAIVDGRDLPFASCAFDEETASHELAKALVSLGYARPLVFNSSSERADLAARTRALIEGFVRAGLSPDAITLSEKPTAVSRAAGDDELLALGDADLVVCVEGAVLPAVYRHIRARGHRVGADVAVTAFGQYAIADALRPHLTTVMIPLRRAGELALEHALADTEGTHLSLPCSLRMRASTPRRIIGQRPPISSPSPSIPDLGGTVGVVVPAPAAGMWPFIAEVLSLARAEDRHCIVLAEESLRGEGADASIFDSCDALLAWGPLSPAVVQRARAASMPCVSVDLPNTAETAQLSVEAAEGVQSALEHLYALGHSRIVYLAGDEADPAETQRRWGIELFLATHHDVSIQPLPFEGEAAGEAVFDAGVTAVVAHSDVQGARVVRSLMSSDRVVPDDMSVVGFGDDWASELSAPSLTTVSVDMAAAARAAWRLLRTGAPPGETRSLRVSLAVRGSTGPARAR